MPSFLKPGQGTDTSFQKLTAVSLKNRNHYPFRDQSTIVYEAIPKLEPGISIIICGPLGVGKSSMVAQLVAEAVAGTKAIENQTDNVITPIWSGQVLHSPVLDDLTTGLPGRSYTEVISSSQPKWGAKWHGRGNVLPLNDTFMLEDYPTISHHPQWIWYGDPIVLDERPQQVYITRYDAVVVPRDESITFEHRQVSEGQDHLVTANFRGTEEFPFAKPTPPPHPIIARVRAGFSILVLSALHPGRSLEIDKSTGNVRLVLDD